MKFKITLTIIMVISILMLLGAAGYQQIFNDGLFKIYDNSDTTKRINFQVSGVTTGNTRTITAADRDLSLSQPVFDSIHVGSTQWNSGDSIDATKVANADIGDIDTSSGVWTIEPEFISGKSDTTAASGDYFIFWDVTDSQLKKCDADEVIGGGGATAWDDIGDPDNSGTKTITFDNAEKSVLTGDNDEAGSFFTLQNTDTDHTVGQLYLLDLYYSADDGDADADFIRLRDGGGDVMTIQEDGDITTNGLIGSLGITTGSVITNSINASGVADLDYGDSQKTDHTFTTDDCTFIIDGGITVSTGDKIQIGSTQWNSGDSIDATKVADADIGDIDTSSGSWTIEPEFISGKDDTTADSSDYFLFWDGTDSQLKKCDADEVLGGAGGGDPVLIDGTPVTDGAGVDFKSGVGVDITFNSGASPDTATFDFTPADISGGTTWDDGGEASVIWQWNLTAGDPAITFGNGVVNISSGVLQEGGNAVWNSSETDIIDSQHYIAASIDHEHLADDVISGASAVGTFESGDKILVLETGVGLRQADYDDLPGGGGNYLTNNAADEMVASTDGVTELIIRNTDGTLSSETYLLELQHTADGSANGDFIKCTDAYGGTPATLFNLEYNGNVTAAGTIEGATLTEGGNAVWNDNDTDIVDDTHINWASLSYLGEEGAITVTDSTSSSCYVALWESATGDLPAYSDGGLTYNASTANLSTTTFTGALSGNATTCTTASAGDAAADFFGAGVHAVTDGTACTDIEGTGLSITAGTLNWSAASTDLTDTADLLYETELDEFSELQSQIADKTLVNTADGATWAGTHDFKSATVKLPARVIFCFNIKDIDDSCDDIKMTFPSAMTITQVTAYVTGGTNVVGRLYEVDGDGDDSDAVGVETSDWTFTTGETEDTSFNNATFDAGDYIQWDTTSVSGTVTGFSLTVWGYET